jgi:hypothetical protein
VPVYVVVREALARRRYAEDLALLRTADHDAAGHLVPFDDHVDQLGAALGSGGVPSLHDLPEALDAVLVLFGGEWLTTSSATSSFRTSRFWSL